MATVVQKITKLSHKCFRYLLKKFRRKKKRQLAAKAREEQELNEQKKRESVPGYWEQQAEKERNAKLWEEFEERERERNHRLWLLREAEAQAEFRKKKQLQEKEKIKREEERKRILAEIEEKQLVENASLEKNKKVKQKKEETLQEALSSLPDGNEPWHNPLAPQNYSVPSQETEKCQFYIKTGCCRFGDRCSRGHPRPSTSCTLLIKGMYSHFSIGQADRDDYDTDMALEYEDNETYQDFENFYEDVLPEFKKFGRVIQFKVCCNHEPHLRGNVYVQYSRESEAVEACQMFNGRYYAGRQLTCEFSNVTNWKSAVCGLYHHKRCPKGNNCNFLHVFRNPGNEFWATAKDYNSENHDRRDRSHISHPFSSRRSYTNNSYHENRENYRSSSHYSYRNKRRHSSESDESDEHSRTESHKSYKRSRSRTPRRESQKKKKKKRSHRRSRSRSPASSYSDEHYEHNISNKRKKRKKSKKVSKRRASSEDS